MYAILGDSYWRGETEFFSSDLTAAYVQTAMMIATLGIAVYFIRKWSKDWNAKIAEKP